MPRVGIIVPIYNVQNYLKKCLDSLLAQTHQKLSIVLVNDGSTDMSLEIAKTYCALDSRFILINKKNGGLSSARNAGLDFLTKNFRNFYQSHQVQSILFGSDLLNPTCPPPPLQSLKQIAYVFFLDSDDFIQPDCIDYYVQVAQKNHLEIVGSGVGRYSNDYRLVKRDFSLFESIVKNQVLEGEVILRKIPQNYFHAVCNLLIDFDFLKRYGFHFVPNIIYEDHCFGTFLFLCAKRVMIVDKYFYAQVNSLNSITRPMQMTEERKILNFESWVKTIEKMENFPLHKDLLNRHIAYFYLPCAYEAYFKLRYKQSCKDKLKQFDYWSWKIV